MWAAFLLPGTFNTGGVAMRDFKTVGVRLSKAEDQQLTKLAQAAGVTASELIRQWLEKEAREAWRQAQTQQASATA
jgi:predicted transcriptional regulator